MSTIEEIRKKRLEKLKKIELAGENPYPIEVKRTHTIEQAIDNFLVLTKQETEVILVGRIRTMRIHGALTFLILKMVLGNFKLF